MEELIPALLRCHQFVESQDGWISAVQPLLSDIRFPEARWKAASEDRSIWDIVLHMTVWTEWAVARLEHRSIEVSDWPPISETPNAVQWESAKEELFRSLNQFAEQIQKQTPETLLQRSTDSESPDTIFLTIQSILLHNAYHAGQITKIRDAYAKTSLQSPHLLDRMKAVDRDLAHRYRQKPGE